MSLAAITDNLKEIDTTSLVDKVEDSLVQLLRQQKLKVGDSIPKEIDLAQTLGVAEQLSEKRCFAFE